MATICKFPVWKTVRIGVYKNGNYFAMEIESKGNKVTSWAKDIMLETGFILPEKEECVPLVLVSVADLGFKGETDTRSVFDRIGSFGLQFCPAPVAPQCLILEDWEIIKCVTFGHKPIKDFLKHQLLFFVKPHVGYRQLDATFGHPECPRKPDELFVFTPCN